MKSNPTPHSLMRALSGFFVSLFGILGWLFQSILHILTCGLLLCGLIGLLIYAKVRPELDHCREVAYDKLRRCSARTSVCCLTQKYTIKTIS